MLRSAGILPVPKNAAETAALQCVGRHNILWSSFRPKKKKSVARNPATLLNSFKTQNAIRKARNDGNRRLPKGGLAP